MKYQVQLYNRIVIEYKNKVVENHILDPIYTYTSRDSDEDINELLGHLKRNDVLDPIVLIPKELWILYVYHLTHYTRQHILCKNIARMTQMVEFKCVPLIPLSVKLRTEWRHFRQLVLKR